MPWPNTIWFEVPAAAVTILFPIALIKRTYDKIFSVKDSDHNEVKMPSKIINHLFLLLMRFENFLLKYMSLPFGLSVMVLAKKKGLNQKIYW